MRKLKLPILGFCVALGIGMITTSAHAQATRTWVSGVGDDMFPCSRTAPCKTFAGAISKTATNGEINCLDPGGFGAVTITKSITIDCHEIYASVLVQGTNAIAIAYDLFAAGDVRRSVRLRNINFNGADTGLNGIRITGGAQSANSEVAIEDCMIDGFNGSPGRGIADERTQNTAKLLVSNTSIRNTAGAGIISTGPSNASISHVRAFNVQAGIVVVGGGKTVVSNSVVAGNSIGLESDNNGADLFIDQSTVSNNVTGLLTTAGGVIRIGNSNIINNTTGVTGTVNSFTTNRFIGNGGAGTLTPIPPAGTNPSGQN